MRIVIWIVGAVIVLEGAAMLIKPEIFRRMIKFFGHGRLIYIPAVLRIALGVVFLISALSCKLPWIIITLGIIILAAGIGTFAVSLDWLKKMLDWWCQRPQIIFRLISIIAVLLGALIIYAAGMPQ